MRYSKTIDHWTMLSIAISSIICLGIILSSIFHASGRPLTCPSFSAPTMIFCGEEIFAQTNKAEFQPAVLQCRPRLDPTTTTTAMHMLRNVRIMNGFGLFGSRVVLLGGEIDGWMEVEHAQGGRLVLQSDGETEKADRNDAEEEEEDKVKNDDPGNAEQVRSIETSREDTEFFIVPGVLGHQVYVNSLYLFDKGAGYRWTGMKDLACYEVDVRV